MISHEETGPGPPHEEVIRIIIPVEAFIPSSLKKGDEVKGNP
jgi:hypothetical protein